MIVWALSISRRWLDGFLIFIVAIVSLYGTARLGLKPYDPAAGVGVIFAPWVSETSAMTRATAAGGRFVRFGGLPFIVVVVPEAVDYVARISEEGALLVVDPQALAACRALIDGVARS